MGKLSKCLQKSPTSLLQCWSQRHVEVVALEQISPVLVLRVKSSVCSLWALSPQNSRCVRASLHPLRLYRGYATHSGESRYVAGLGGWVDLGCSPRGNLLFVSHENRLLAVGFLCGVTSVLMGCVPCLVRSDLDEENEDDQYWLWKLWAAILPPVLYGVDVILAGSGFVNRVLVPSCKLKPHKLFDVCHTM